jgi:CspA family cold shock protein
MSDNKKYIGTVVFFVNGFGFIEWEGEEDMFLHFSDIQSEGYKTVKKGQKVEFEIGKNNKGQDKAINVLPL